MHRETDKPERNEWTTNYLSAFDWGRQKIMQSRVIGFWPKDRLRVKKKKWTGYCVTRKLEINTKLFLKTSFLKVKVFKFLWYDNHYDANTVCQCI